MGVAGASGCSDEGWKSCGAQPLKRTRERVLTESPRLFQPPLLGVPIFGFEEFRYLSPCRACSVSVMPCRSA